MTTKADELSIYAGWNNYDPEDSFILIRIPNDFRTPHEEPNRQKLDAFLNESIKLLHMASGAFSL